MISTEKYIYYLFFLAFSFLSLNLSTLAMKRQSSNDDTNEFALEKKKQDSIFYELTIPYNIENEKFYCTLVLTLRSYSFDIPKELIKEVMKSTIKFHEMNSPKKTAEQVTKNYDNTINIALINWSDSDFDDDSQNGF